MLRLRHSQALQHQPPQHQALNQCPVWNGVKTGEPRGAPVARNVVRRGALVVRNDVKHGELPARSDVKHDEPLARSDVRHGAECTCSRANAAERS